MHIAFICVKQRVERGGTRDAIYAEEMDEKGLSRSAWWDGPLFGHSYGGVLDRRKSMKCSHRVTPSLPTRARGSEHRFP